MPRYKDLMFNLSVAQLKEFLGRNMIDTMLEWSPSSEDLLTKKKLIDMIIYLHGTNILKNKSFRTALLYALPNQKEIIQLRDEFLSGKEKEEKQIQNIVNTIASKTWGNNNLSKKLLEIWEYPIDIFDKPEEKTIVTQDIDIEKQFYELLDYQYLIRQKALNILNSGNEQERMLIHMPTGTGKTKTAMHIIANYYSFTLKNKGAVIWIAHTTELLQQACDTFIDVWSHHGNKSIKIYRLSGNNTITQDEEIDGIVFCGLSKLMSIKNTNEKLFNRLKKDCRLIVFDEAHKASAEQTKIIIEDLLLMPNGFENRALIGLSATPGRTTADTYNNALLSNMFGNKLISIDTDLLNRINMGKLEALNSIAENNIIKYFQERGILSEINVERLKYNQNFTDAEKEKLIKKIQYLGENEGDYSSEQLRIIENNINRNKQIMIKLRELNLLKIPTIVFACSVSHAKMISAMLTLEGIPNSLVVGELDSATRKKAIMDFKNTESNVNIIINYEVLTTGFDSTNIKCVFITRPTKSIVLYSQMLGRGLRGPMMGGNKSCLLIDIDDNLQAFDNEKAFNHFNDYWK